MYVQEGKVTSMIFALCSTLLMIVCVERGVVDNGALDHSHAWQAPMTLLLSLAYIATWPGVWSISSGGALDHATEGGQVPASMSYRHGPNGGFTSTLWLHLVSDDLVGPTFNLVGKLCLWIYKGEGVHNHWLLVALFCRERLLLDPSYWLYTSHDTTNDICFPMGRDSYLLHNKKCFSLKLATPKAHIQYTPNIASNPISLFHVSICSGDK